MSEIIKLNMVTDFWKHADEGLRDERSRMVKGFAFYVGDQWAAADIAKMDNSLIKCAT